MDDQVFLELLVVSGLGASGNGSHWVGRKMGQSIIMQLEGGQRAELKELSLAYILRLYQSRPQSPALPASVASPVASPDAVSLLPPCSGCLFAQGHPQAMNTNKTCHDFPYFIT